MIRHAEKDVSNPDNRDPELTEIGIQRAKNWATILEKATIEAVYSTNYKRTLNTAVPTADRNNVNTVLYDVGSFDLESFKKNTKGMNVLIVGHSNTIPFLANDLIGESSYQQIEDKDYSNLFIITIANKTVSHTLLKIN